MEVDKNKKYLSDVGKGIERPKGAPMGETSGESFAGLPGTFQGRPRRATRVTL